MALDKVKQGVIADDAVGSSQIAPDTVVAADIGANAILSVSLASAHIAAKANDIPIYQHFSKVY